MMLQEHLGSSKDFVILHRQPVVFWDSFQPKCFDGQGNILALQVVWRLWQKWVWWVEISPSCILRHPGVALCGHVGCGDTGTVVGVNSLVLKSSTKFSFYIDAWIYRVGGFFVLLNSSICHVQLFPSPCQWTCIVWTDDVIRHSGFPFAYSKLCLVFSLPSWFLNYWLFFSSFSRIQRLSLEYCLAISTGIRRSWWRGKQPP